MDAAEVRARIRVRVMVNPKPSANHSAAPIPHIITDTYAIKDR